ncbi:heme exporter protein D [Cereibacter ovatus]|uniref:Heme exporter protein D n=1 Tax=Cereibacter ovatus TaxID=439529 RepID=A0A285D3S7_9RHOB|nr:heme exporter protein CcmD [Cereibacter ovatus]SNX73813.1 heme exporter protein D [Cereibacter ovatus]
MLPDLGKYALPVLTAYGASLGLILAIVLLTLWRGTRVRRLLRDVEQRQGRTDV